MTPIRRWLRSSRVPPALSPPGDAACEHDGAVASGGRGASAVEQELRDLDRVQRRALAQVVAREEQREARSRRSGRGGCGRRARRRSRPPCPATGSPRRAPTARPPSSSRARSAESGCSVSSQTASAWPTITGTRTHVALDRQVGQLHDLPRLGAELRLLVELLAVEVPVHAQVVLVRRPRRGAAPSPARPRPTPTGTSRRARARGRPPRAAA